MNKIFQRVLVLSGTMALLVMGGPGTSWAEHSWGDYHWARTSNPLPLMVVDSVSAEWQFEFDIALSEWNQSAVLNMSVGSANDSSRTQAMQDGSGTNAGV